MRFAPLQRLLLLAILAAATGALAASNKPLLVHYLPWYEAKPHSGNWGWHWTMNHFDPDTSNAAGRREIASQYYPLIGPYDSADPVVLEYHVLLMKLSGIDGVVADWYGPEDYLDYGMINQRTLALRDFTRRAGLTFALCYEDRTVQAKIDGGYLAATNAISNAQQALAYAEANYFCAPHYLRLAGRPVVLNFGPIYFRAGADWVNVFSRLNVSNQPAFFTEDQRLGPAQGGYSWPPMQLSAQNNGTLSPAMLEKYLNGFQAAAKAWPAFVGSAFPRFQDIYEQAGLGFTYGLLADEGGQTFRTTLRRAMTGDSALVQIVTWNDFGEGTVIEPTEEFGYRDLGVVQDFRRQYFEPDFPATTNDLALPLQLYQLRRRYAEDELVARELDRAFTNIVSGQLVQARSRLAGLERRQSVTRSLALTNAPLQLTASARGADTNTPATDLKRRAANP